MKREVDMKKKMKKRGNSYLDASRSLDKQAVLRYHYLIRQSLLRPPPNLRRRFTNFPIGVNGGGTVQTPGSSIESFGRSAAGTVQTSGSSINPFGESTACTVQTPGSSIYPFGGSGAGTIQLPGSSRDPIGGIGVSITQTSRSSIESFGGSGDGTIQTPWSSIDPLGEIVEAAINRTGSSVFELNEIRGGNTQTPWPSVEPIEGNGAGSTQTPWSSTESFSGSGAGNSQTPGSFIYPHREIVEAGIKRTGSSNIAPIRAGTTQTTSFPIVPVDGGGASTTQTPSFSAVTIGRSGTGSLSLLEGLAPISLSEMEIDSVHRGRVLYGTLCADAFTMNNVNTVLEDVNGLAARLNIGKAPDSTTKIESLYPKGAKVGIRDPILRRMPDDTLRLAVEDPAAIQFLNDHEVDRK